MIDEPQLTSSENSEPIEEIKVGKISKVFNWLKEKFKRDTVKILTISVIILLSFGVGVWAKYQQSLKTDKTGIRKGGFQDLLKTIMSDEEGLEENQQETNGNGDGKIEPLPAPVASVIPSVAPSPTRQENPPVIKISYPAEGQSIELTTDQTFCLVDTPEGGNTTGIQRKHRINNAGWTGYASMTTLCFDPQEGSNTVALQYRNSFGDESIIYSRQFQFHRIEDINISITGQIYKDHNCNGSRDNGEANLDVSAEVTLWENFVVLKQEHSNSNGEFSLGYTIKGNESRTFEVSVQSPYGYKADPSVGSPQMTFSKNNQSASVEIPQVPAADIGNCQVP